LRINTKYYLSCPSCGAKYDDDGFRINCDACFVDKQKSILKFEPTVTPKIDKTARGLKRYLSFLPKMENSFEAPNFLETFPSTGFAEEYGFKRLYLTVTGYVPERNINSPTCSFKDLETFTVLQRRLSHNVRKPLLLSSAGNTARAFVYYAAHVEHPVIIVLPAASRNFLWLHCEDGLLERVKKYCKVIFVDQPANYRDASKLSRCIAEEIKGSSHEEGGYHNIGRTTGLGICALSFFDTVNDIPDHYVQAVGSGVGVLAALRNYAFLSGDRARDITYHLVQNIPYTPLVDAIERNKSFSVHEYISYIDTSCSPMLTSAEPAYDPSGGMRDAMKSGHHLCGHGATNNEILHAHHEFWRLEGIETTLPAAAAVAMLIKASRTGQIPKGDLIQLNITGCGESALKHDKGYFYVPASCTSATKECCQDRSQFLKWIDTVREELCNTPQI